MKPALSNLKPLKSLLFLFHSLYITKCHRNRNSKIKRNVILSCFYDANYIFISYVTENVNKQKNWTFISDKLTIYIYGKKNILHMK